MGTYRIRVFTVPAPAEVPAAGPMPPPRETSACSVDCDGGVEEVRKAATARLVAMGYTPRSLSFTTDGGLIAVCQGKV